MDSNFKLMIYGSIGVVIGLVMFGVSLSQLQTTMTTVNATPTGMFPGLYSVMGVWGLVLFIAFMGAGLAMLGAGAYGAIRKGGGGRRRR